MRSRRVLGPGLGTLLILLLAGGTVGGSTGLSVDGAGPQSDGVAQEPLPTKVGQEFIIEDFDNAVTEGDLGFNYFMGNTGATESSEGITTISWSEESNGSDGGSLRLSFDFSGQPPEGPFAGYFASLFGLTDTLVSLDGSGEEPEESWHFPDYFLDTEGVFRGILLWPDRSLEELRFDVRLESLEDVVLKIELKDEDGFDVFTRHTISDGGTGWEPVSLSIPSGFTDSVAGNGDTSPFDWQRASVLSFIVERANVGAGVSNPTTGEFLIDNLAVVDADGECPDLESAGDPVDGGILPQYTDAFLDLVRATSFLYFLDFASTDPRTGGITQDRSTFADLMSVGGAGFQLTSYVVAAERGYISREDAAERTHSILQVLHDYPQGAERVGTTGYKGFFYHFLGIDGLRKQNFDFEDTADVDESLNTVELSTIDTALVTAGVVTAMQYFDGGTGLEPEIRAMGQAIYERVDWCFMLEPVSNQFYLGWKPNEERDDTSGRWGRFLIDDGYVLGQYSSKDVGGGEEPATIDYYTDEGVLIALLAVASPNEECTIPDDFFFSMIREDEGGPFVTTYPGSLFTYQFGSVWLDTEALRADAHPIRPINYFENSRRAIEATREYATTNPEGRATLNEDRWGLSACDGPFDDYFAEAAPPAAIADAGQCVGHGPAFGLEGEDGTGDGSVKDRGAASGQQTVWLHEGESRTLSFDLDSTALYEVAVRYSNDNDGPLETVEVAIDGMSIGEFEAQDTGDFGLGWNVFEWSGPVGSLVVPPGSHDVVVSVAGGDGFGVEIDVVSLDPLPVERPLEVGTVTVYGVGSSVVHTPDEAVAALWEAQSLGLLHPRFGFADAFNLEINDAVIPGCVHPDEDRVLRADGSWAHATGFAIDHGPMLILIDNYLADQFVPSLFMSYPTISDALDRLFACVDREGDTQCDDVANDRDDDGCTDAEEAALGDNFDGDAWYDVYDVPVPAKADGDGANGKRNKVIDIGDVLAVLFYAFADDNGGPNANGVDYDSIKGWDGDGDSVNDASPVQDIEEGLKYDRSPGLGPSGDTGKDPAGAPNGSIDIGDVLAVLAQAFVVDCTPP